MNFTLKIRKWVIELEIIEIPINLFLNGSSHIQSCLKYLKIILNIEHFRKIIINSTKMVEIFHQRFQVGNCWEKMIN